MRLIIDRTEAAGIPGARALYLYGDDGEALPNQRAVRLDQRAGEPSTVTVEFVIDGDKVKLGDR